VEHVACLGQNFIVIYGKIFKTPISKKFKDLSNLRTLVPEKHAGQKIPKVLAFVYLMDMGM
jgi:hypothetical protein